MENNAVYPRFISSKPCGIDKFESKSQKRLTNAIANHIVSNDNVNNSHNLSRIIGLEGGWGVGKSNVIKQLKQHESIKNDYFLFEYDAWGHQEDLQRRSFLEILTTVLIDEEVLSGKTEIKSKGEELKEVSWEKKLKYLLAQKREIDTEKRPKLNDSFVAFIVATIFTPIFVSIANIASIKLNPFWWWVSLLLPFIPAIIFIIYCFCQNKGYKRAFKEIISIYSGKIENEVIYETISEEEPTVTEFKKWMQSISQNIGTQNKKLIIVYDNMDRLPAEKVKELWSSIHTFFSEDGFENIWAIIPFDETHLSCAFGESNDKKQLTKYFISKTFPVVYHVTPPVITDFKEIFNTLFLEAFGNTENEQKDEINRIFRLEKPNATIRELIEYINQIVALKNTWLDTIDILYIAIFVLKKDILQKPIEQIPSGDYLGTYIPKIISNDEDLQKNISALVYGVSPEKAIQIPMSRYIDSCFNLEQNTDINKFKDSDSFIHILSDKINNLDIAQLDNTIQCLFKLDTSTLSEENQQTIINLWNTIAQRKIKTPLKEQDFDDNYKLLIKNSNDENKQKIIKSFCKQIQNFEKFDGQMYFVALSSLDDFLKSNNIFFDISEYLVEKSTDPKSFISYVIEAKESYTNFKLVSNTDELNEYLLTLNPDTYTWKQVKELKNQKGLTDYSHSHLLNVLKLLCKNKVYNFDEFLNHIQEQIPNADEKNFKLFFDVYKFLSDEMPLTIQLTPTQRQTIWNALAAKTNTPEYLEIVAIQISNGTNTGGSYTDEQIKYIAENLDYYANYGDLLISNLSWGISPLTQALKYMTENKLGNNLSLEELLPRFFEIKNQLAVTEAVLLNQLNDWEKHKDSITASNIERIIPQANFFQFSKETKNDLTDYLNITINKVLFDKTTDELYQLNQSQPQSYWIVVLNTFIDTDFIKTLPDNLTELGKRYLDDIAASRIAVPNTNDIQHKIINKLDKRKTAAHIKDIRDKYCNSQYSINSQQFLFFESWFENQGDLKQIASRATHKIIEPIISDTNCLNNIMSKSDYYAEIINSASDDAMELKNNVKKMLDDRDEENFISFAKKIGVKKKEQKNE